MPHALAAHDLLALEAHWRGANSLSTGQTDLLARSWLAEPLAIDHGKPWGCFHLLAMPSAASREGKRLYP